MKKLIFLLSTFRKSKEKIKKELKQAYRKFLSVQNNHKDGFDDRTEQEQGTGFQFLGQKKPKDLREKEDNTELDEDLLNDLESDEEGEMEITFVRRTKKKK